jgi:predicted anti-sigma-YlaC factor YlaD
MICSRFTRILADFLEGKLSRDDESAAEAHLGSCSDCRGFLEMARGSVDILPGNRREELTRSILECTSGPVCRRVESCLWDFVAGGAGAEDSQLIALHLDHCAGCKSLAEEFAEMQGMLPAMAQVEPGGAFTREVVSLISGVRPYRSRLRIRFLTWWNRIVYRPRFSLEAAYIGTLVIVFLFGSPFLPFRNMTFEKVSSGAIQPSTNHLLSVWAGAKAPVLNGLNSFQSVAKSLSNAAVNCGHLSASIADASAQGIRSWHRKESAAFRTVWQRLFQGTKLGCSPVSLIPLRSTNSYAAK